jgi:hypothetical protein
MARIGPETKAHLQPDTAQKRAETLGEAPDPAARLVRATKSSRILYPAAAVITAILLLIMAAV